MVRGMTDTDRNSDIGTMGERSLHAALKQWYARPGDRTEVHIDGFLVDIVRGNLLIEIQTRNFPSIRRKLAALTENHRVRLVHPIALEKWIVRLGPDGLTQLGRRKSPKRGHAIQVFEELVSIPELIADANFSIELLLIQEEEIRRKGGARNWRRRGWGTFDRRLIDVVDRQLLQTPSDFAAFIPPGLIEPFTTQDLAEALGRPRDEAQQMAYCLRKMGVVAPVGKQGNAILYARAGVRPVGCDTVL